MLPAGNDSPAITAYSSSNPNGWEDHGHWSTGNGWAAAGMLRVIATIMNSQYASQYADEIQRLKLWVEEIHAGMAPKLPKSGVFNNYVDDTRTIPDASSTALFASTVYRAATLYDLTSHKQHLTVADVVRTSLFSPEGNHFDEQGWLQPVCNPNKYTEPGEKSPEGQAFVLQLSNNWRQWQTLQTRATASNQVANAQQSVPQNRTSQAEESESSAGFVAKVPRLALLPFWISLLALLLGFGLM